LPPPPPPNQPNLRNMQASTVQTRLKLSAGLQPPPEQRQRLPFGEANTGPSEPAPAQPHALQTLLKRLYPTAAQGAPGERHTNAGLPQESPRGMHTNAAPPGAAKPTAVRPNSPAPPPEAAEQPVVSDATQAPAQALVWHDRMGETLWYWGCSLAESAKPQGSGRARTDKCKGENRSVFHGGFPTCLFTVLGAEVGVLGVEFWKCDRWA